MSSRRRGRPHGYVPSVVEEPNVAEYAQFLAEVMSADLDDEVQAIDVLDWLASTGLTLRRDKGDSAAAYGLLVGEVTDVLGIPVPADIDED